MECQYIRRRRDHGLAVEWVARDAFGDRFRFADQPARADVESLPNQYPLAGVDQMAG